LRLLLGEERPKQLTVFRHVDYDRCFRCEVRDSFFNDGYFQGTGGYSYGVVCGNRSTDCLTENNIFYHLRHSMVVKEGAAGCVYGYNYSYNTYQADDGLLLICSFTALMPHESFRRKLWPPKWMVTSLMAAARTTHFSENLASRTSGAQTINNGRFAVNHDNTTNVPQLCRQCPRPI